MPLQARSALNPKRLLAVSLAALLGLFVLAGLDVGGQAALWENAHWTLSSVIALSLVLGAWRHRPTTGRPMAALVVLGLGLYALGEFVWDVQVAAGLYLVPAPSDLFFLGAALPLSAVGVVVARRTLPKGEALALAVDGLIVLLGVATVVLFAFEPIASGTTPDLGAILLAYPILYIGFGGFMLLVGAAAGGLGDWRHGPLPAAFGLTLIGITWVLWIREAIVAFPAPGSVLNMVSSVAIIIVAHGYRTWDRDGSVDPTATALTGVARAALPVGAAVSAAALLVVHHGTEHLDVDAIDVTAWSVIALALVRQTMLLLDRTRSVAREQVAAERERDLRIVAERAVAGEAASQARYRRIVEVFGRLGERLTFEVDEQHQLDAAAAAIAGIVTGAGEITLINPSRDRLELVMAWGDELRAAGAGAGAALLLDCYGIRRGAPFSIDTTESFSAPCPVFPAKSGATLCLPLVVNGASIGVIHLGTAAVIDDDDRVHLVRIAEQVALAIANGRLLQTTRELALTDPLTGLHNSRFLDPYMDRELAHAERTNESVGVVMIDLDHFKSFNDTHGHPAGDEALRAFAAAAKAAVRREDTIARYGGEEFVLLVRDADTAAAAAVAENVRAATEAMVVDLGPGRKARLTASFGVVASASGGLDRMDLIRAADEALYRAKAEGRNRVVVG